jgi:Transposase
MNELKCWFVGVDWASESHRVRITDGCGKRLGERDFAHGGAGLAEMAAWLTSVAGADPSAIHVAIEMPHGPIVETLLERGFNVYAIPSSSIASVIVSRRPAPRTTAVTPRCLLTRCAPICAPSASLLLLSHWSSSCVNGRA